MFGVVVMVLGIPESEKYALNYSIDPLLKGVFELRETFWIHTTKINNPWTLLFDLQH